MAEALQAAGVKLGNLWDVIVNLIGALCGWMLILSVAHWPNVALGFFPRFSAVASLLWMPDGFMGAVDTMEAYMYAHSWLFLSVSVLLLIGIVMAIRDVDDTEEPEEVFYDTKPLYYENCTPCLLIAVTLPIALGKLWVAAAEVIVLLLLLAVLRRYFQQSRARSKTFPDRLKEVAEEASIGIIVTLLFPVDLLWRLFVYTTPPSRAKQAEVKEKYEESHSAPDGARRRHGRP